MSAAETYEEIERSVLHLPLPERSRLASRLLESLDQDDDFPLNESWVDEIGRRVDEIESGEATLIPHEEVVERVKAKLDEVRRGKHRE